MRTMVAVLVAALAAAGAARAQTGDFVQTLSAGIEEAGQSLGAAAFSGPSLFVTAKGHARLPAPLADSYFVTVEGKHASAVVATRLRDAKLAQLVSLAKRSGVDIEQGDTSVALETDTDAQRQAAQRQRAQATTPMTPGSMSFQYQPLPPAPKVFVASASLRFRAPANADAAAFLDAVHAAGVDTLTRGVSATANPFLPHGSETLGFGSAETLDDSLWSAAANDALGHARVQAQALATASGRALGPVRSIIVLSRGVEGGEASETLAIRFALGDHAR